jgi:hypothetical protein
LRTSLISAAAITYLLSSGISHYQYVGVILIGWCGMQFAEYLLWSKNPAKGCTPMNKLITLFFIPLVLMFQPLGSVLGSLFIKPWNKCTPFRKQFLVWFSALVVAGVTGFTWYFKEKSCTIVTQQYHLHWHTYKYVAKERNWGIYALWAFIIVIPLFMFWDKSKLFLMALIMAPLFGFLYGYFYTDSKASLWCFYTSYTSVIAVAALAAKQLGFGDALYAKLY